jgi:excisionase family DNA binding protein
MDELINPQEAARLLSVKPVTVYQWIRKGLISYYQLGRCKRMRLEDVERFVHEHRVEKKN